MAYKYKQGFFNPNNPEKYQGNVKQIVYRSWLEFRYMRVLDNDPNIISWASEEIRIPYLSPKDNRIRGYYPDLWYMTADKQKYIVEIKPAEQCIPPKKGRKKEKTFLTEVMTYGINQAKWKAARKFCEHHGLKFLIATEKNLK